MINGCMYKKGNIIDIDDKLAQGLITRQKAEKVVDKTPELTEITIFKGQNTAPTPAISENITKNTENLPVKTEIKQDENSDNSDSDENDLDPVLEEARKLAIESGVDYLDTDTVEQILEKIDEKEDGE